MIYDFDSKLGYSKGVVADTDPETIRGLLPGCTSVEPTTTAVDRTGVDYVATLRGGRVVTIDVKTREPGCARWWSSTVPEVALEDWSVKPGSKVVHGTPMPDDQQTGWTLDESKETEYVLFRWHEDDSRDAYIVPFQLLRKAFRANYRKWDRKYRSNRPQSSQRNGCYWQSDCVFVPINEVLEAVTIAMWETID